MFGNIFDMYLFWCKNFNKIMFLLRFDGKAVFHENMGLTFFNSIKAKSTFQKKAVFKFYQTVF